MQGHALPLDGAAAPARDSVFAEEDLEGNVLQAVRTRDVEADHGQPGQPARAAPEELYDVASRSRRAARRLVASEPVLVEEMRAALGRSYLEARAHAGAARRPTSTASRKDRLRALGYVD